MKEFERIVGADVLLDISPDLLCLTDQNGYFLKVNKFLLKTLGYAANELIGKHCLDFIHLEDQEISHKQLEILFENETVSSFKNRYRCANGLYKSFSWNAIRLPDKTFFASARDITHYLNVQNQLTKALTDNQKIYDNSLDVICTFNAEGKFTKVSKAAKAIWGYDEQKLLGTNAYALVHPDDLPLTVAIRKELIAGNSQTNFENRYIHKNGSVVPLIWSAQWLPAENCMFATARDATEREKQKVQLHFNERRLEALLKSGNDIICIFGADGCYRYVSPSVKNALHYEPEFFLGKTPFEFMHPDDVLQVKTDFEQILTTTENVHISPFRFKNAMGEWCWLETFAANLLDDPAINGIMINSRDISIKIKDEEEKRLAAEKLRISNERNELVTEATRDVVWDCNLETYRMSWNSVLKTGFGYSETDNIAQFKFWETYIHPDDKGYVLKGIRKIINDPDEKFWREEYRFIKADGSVAHIIDQGYVIRNADKKAIRMVGAMHDNTELKEKELRILNQNKQLREIAQINSHIIRRPVASILGLIELIDKKAVSGAENLEILAHLLSATQELDTVIRQINDKTLD